MDNVVSWLKLGAKFLFSFAILFYMVQTGRLDLSVVSRGFSQVHLLLISATLVFLALITSLYRWALLLRGQGLHFRFAEIARYGMIGAFFNTTMPGAVSGDLIKAWYLVSDYKGQKKTPVLSSIVLDRAMGVFGLVLVSASPILFRWDLVSTQPELRQITWFVMALFGCVVLFFTYLMVAVNGKLNFARRLIERYENTKVGKVALQAYDSWIEFGKKPWLLVKAMALSVCTHLMIVTVVILCSQALGDHTVDRTHYFLLVPVGLLTTAVPVAPAGLGVGHAAFAALFSMAGSSHGAEVFTMLVTLQIAWNLTGVFFYLRSPRVVQPTA